MKKIKQIIKKILLKNLFLSKIYENKLLRKEEKEYISKVNTFNKNGSTVIQEFLEICNSLNIKCWLVYGTLLGYVREHGLIKHDYDFDLGIWKEDYSNKLKNTLKENGFELIHQFYGINYDAFEQTYEKKGVSIDIFYSYKNEQMVWTHVFHRENNDILPNDTWRVRKLPYPNKGLTEINFFNKKTFIPSNYEEYLALTYGDGWKIPDPNFDRKNGPYADSIIPNGYGKMEHFN